MKVAIGFDTSCYTTSVAAVDSEGNVVTSQRLLLPVVSGQRGLRQSEAVFAHVRQLPQLTKAASGFLGGSTICAVAAATAPRDEEGSYMPVFRVGESHGKTLANMLHIPFFGFSHQQGHIAAGQLGIGALPERFVAMHISGGTTEVLQSNGGTLTLLGGTKDLHAGQLIDRVGVAMGLAFPAGPALEAFAMQGITTVRALLPASLSRNDLDCHLSGAETQCQQWIARGEPGNSQIAAEVFDMLARTIARMLAAGCSKAGVSHALVVGGVASSHLLRELIRNRLAKNGAPVTVHFGQAQYSADNAAGIAWLGMKRYLQQR